MSRRNGNGHAAPATVRLAATGKRPIVIMATREPQKMGMWAGALAVTMGIATLVLLSGERLQRALGDKAMQVGSP